MNVGELHSETWRSLDARRARLPHALLISGRRGIGKFDLAKRFAESLLCEMPAPSGEPCGKCAACNWLAQGNHPDFRLLQPEAMAEQEGERSAGNETGQKKPSQQITIDQVRALDDFLHVGTHRHGVRAILINPAEAMNPATANALLKALEEPIVSTLFLLVSNEHSRLLPTIRSRCQQVHIPQPAQELAIRWLRASGVDDAAQWLALAGGSPLLAAELGSSGRAVLDALVEHMARGGKLNPLSAAAAVDKVLKAEKGAAPLKRLVDWSQKWLLDLMLATQRLPPRYFVTRRQQVYDLAVATEPHRLLEFHKKAIQYKAQCEQPLNGRLFLEDFFLSYAAIFKIS